MQEGTVAFVQMAKISSAIAVHKSAGLPYLVYLRHPTTGGVMASWGSLGHVTGRAWESIRRSRRSERPGVRRLLRYAATDVIPLNGTAQGESDPGLLIALARFGDSPCQSCTFP